VIALARARLASTRLTHVLIATPLAATLASLLTFVPFQAASLGLMVNVTQAPYELVESRGLDTAVVLVHSLPALSVVPTSWAYYHGNNSPDLGDPSFGTGAGEGQRIDRLSVRSHALSHADEGPGAGPRAPVALSRPRPHHEGAWRRPVRPC
jgi:hypothetical protein